MKKKRLMITLLLLITVFMFIGFAYAYLAGGISNANKQTASITTGTMNLVFADGTTSFQAKSITIGESVTKTFTIENTGTLDTIASLYFKDLKNTYMERSLIYTLEYSTRENGTYTVLRKDATMPRSDAGAKELIYGRITVPAGTKRYYKLTVSFIDTGIDQTADVNATFNTSFTLEAGHDTTSESDKTLAALGLEEYLNEGVPDFTKAATTDEGMFAAEDNYGTSYYFRGNVQNNTLKLLFSDYPQYCYDYILNGDEGITPEYYMGNNGIKYETYSECTANTTNCNEYAEYCHSNYESCHYYGGVDCYGKGTPITKSIDWKIIRINGDGTLRIIAVDESFNEIDNSLTYDEYSEKVLEGYWSLGTGYANYGKEEWYTNNLYDNYDDYISYDTMFCFDTNYYKTEYVTYENYYGDIFFEGYSNSYDAQLRETNPSLYCNLPRDDSNSGQTRLTGNDGLNAPIATVTFDELIMAGMSTSKASKTYIDNVYDEVWGIATMTPYQSHSLMNGAGAIFVTNNVYGYRGDILMGHGIDPDDGYPLYYPVINLKADYAREFIWDAAQNAYVHP